MLKKHIQTDDVSKLDKCSNSSNGHKKSPPSSSNGFTLSTEQLHQLLSGDQANTSKNSFDNAVKKQQQLLVICNTLDRQNSIYAEIDSLLNSSNGIHWLDMQISAFKSLCPAEILLKLSHSSKSFAHEINDTQIIKLQYFSLINEHIFSPLSALAKIDPGTLDDNERKEWHDWCKGLDNEFNTIKQQITSANNFFTLKTFDKIINLAKDTDIQQQIGNTKHLFQNTAFSNKSVEFCD